MPITRRKRINPPPEDTSNHVAEQADQNVEGTLAERTPAPPVEGEGNASPAAREDIIQAAPTNGASLANGGVERQEYVAPAPAEGVKRTSFRRPAQVPAPPAPQPAAPAAVPYQAPSHEITLPLGNLLHLAYNPGYTGADEARSLLLHRLEHESKSGGRARCWNCGSIAIAYDCWNTRSRTFGEVGVAFCEICGVWSVL